MGDGTYEGGAPYRLLPAASPSAAAGPPSARARLLLAEMTLGEKITMLHGCQPVGKAPCGAHPDT